MGVERGMRERRTWEDEGRVKGGAGGGMRSCTSGTFREECAGSSRI